MKYKLQQNGVLDTETGASIPESTSNRHWNAYLQWLTESTGSPPVLNTPDPFETAQEISDRLRSVRIQELKNEGLSRIQAVMPAINNFDTLELVREMWLSVDVSARNATSDFQSIIDIYQAARAGVIFLNTATDGEIAAYDVLTDPAWPA